MTVKKESPFDNKIVRLPSYDEVHLIPGTGAQQPVSSEIQQLSTALLRTRGAGEEVALLVLRISEHHELSETFGETLGSELTQGVEGRLRDCLRHSDLAVKLGDDEFAIILGELEHLEVVRQVANRLVESCGGRYNLDKLNPLIKVAIGIAMYPSDAEQPQELLRFARIALRRADSSKVSHYHFFSQKLLEEQQRKVWMEDELERALAEGRFTLHYQPQYAINSQQIVGMEALVRLVTNTGELIPPNDFIPIAEENGFIVKLGSWVIQEACQQLARWHSAGYGPLRIAVNVSPRQLLDDRLIGIICQAVEESVLRYSDLELEITEQCVLDYVPKTGNILEVLHRKGVRLAVDDFGTGYSSFTYLARLPIDVIKMDRSFLTNLSSDPRAGKVVSAMIAMARELGFKIIAEGVETEHQHQFLQASDCDLGQGFGFARPQDTEAIEKLLTRSPGYRVVG